MADRYNSYKELKSREGRGEDYRIVLDDVGSDTTIIAPHGGRIEPKTSDIARGIARGKYNCYCFEGIKEEKNGRLHITSHNFDEPHAMNIISTSQRVVAVHACTGTDGILYLGGLDCALLDVIAAELDVRGITVSKNHPRFQGTNPNNICNRGAKRKGVQLEIPRDLRDDGDKIKLISDAVHRALEKI